jgi:Fe-S cluster assembly protein SufD
VAEELEALATPEGNTIEVVTGTGTRPAIIADATTGHGDVPVQTRNARFSSTEVTAFPPVTGREATWKLTPVADLKDLIDGELDGSRYEIESTASDGAEITWVGRDDARIGTAGIPEDKAAANAWSSFEQALVIRLTGEESSDATILRSALGSVPRAAHTIIDAARFSKAVVVLDNRGAAQLAENVEILVGDGADLTVVSVQDWADDAKHVANHFAQVGRDARL